ncbi:MAG: methyltransferase [Roseovarius sp.]|nr:methyltransferase [Roseovarius sp.]
MESNWSENKPLADQPTLDDFLGGRLKMLQPRNGYRAGIDPVLLAASIPAHPGQSVLDLGCGTGVAGLCLARRVGNLKISGIEIHQAAAELARRNASGNGLEMDVYTGRVENPPPPLRKLQFDHVMANPPYYAGNTRTPAADAGREFSLAEETPLRTWVATAARRVRPKGSVTFIQRIERLPDLISAMSENLGCLELMPLYPRKGRPPRLFLLRGQKDRRTPFRMHSGWVIHEGDAHVKDGDGYTWETAGILRDGLPLKFPD